MARNNCFAAKRCQKGSSSTDGPFQSAGEVYKLSHVDFHFQLGRQRFVWDTEKAALNRAKHGISFQRAAEVFIDPFVEFVEAEVTEESREAAIGVTLDQALLYVVNIERDDLSIRIISARLASAKERRIYEERA